MAGFNPLVRLAVTLSLALAAHANKHDETLYIAGSGATFPERLYDKWRVALNADRRLEGVEYSYQGVGSTAGKHDLISGPSHLDLRCSYGHRLRHSQCTVTAHLLMRFTVYTDV